VSTHLRSGDSLLTAWSAALGELPLTGQTVAPGRSLADTVTRTTTDADEAVVVQSVSVASELGGPMAATIDAAAALLRERDAIRAEAVAHSAQARLSARVLTAVPLVFATWSTVTSDSFRQSLGTPIGSACIVLGALLNLAGWRWMRRVVAGAER
jgi:tight adherence protein B